MSSRKTQDKPRIGIRRKILFTSIILVVAFLPIAFLELILILSGWQPTELNEASDPFLGFSGDQTLFEKSPDGTRFEIRKIRLGYFRPASFLAEKPDNGYRVFVIGGSTVQGRPWETETAFSKWLELGLLACEPDSTIEVINCGGVSYASYRLSHIVNEVVEYSPDLIVLCSGHNEFLESRTYSIENKLPGFVISIHQGLSRSRSYRWLRAKVIGARTPKKEGPTLGEKVVTKLDFENGLDLFTNENLQRNQVQQHFKYNLQRMISTVMERKVRLLVLSPPSNQRDCFPFKPSADWQPTDSSSFKDSNLAELDSISESDRSADYFFFRGQRNLESGNIRDAKNDLSLAVDHDICPIRMTSKLRQIMTTVVEDAQQTFGRDQLLYLDLQKKCEAESRQQIVGSELLVDHVHPSISTHKKIAVWIVEQLHQKQLIRERENWKDGFQKLAATHQQSLGFGYFQRGKERLESVLKWSRGQAINPLERK